MAKERKASVIYEGNASQLVYAFPFDYLRKKFVKVEDIYTNITELTIGVDYTIEDKQVRLVKGIPLGHSVKIYRETTTAPLVEWQDASVLRSADLSLQEVQLLHLAEETADKVFDSGMSTAYDNPNCWDGQYKRIINALDPIEDGDVVTLRYIKANQDSLLNQLKNTGATQNSSIIATGDTQNKRLTDTGNIYVSTMTTLKDTATIKANDAGNSAELSKKWAMSSSSPDGVTGNKSSKTWAEEAKTSASNANASASASQSSANASSASATQSANSASASKSSANASASSASAAASYAAAASTSASNAKTSETNAANSAASAAQSATEAAKWNPTSYYTKPEVDEKIPTKTSQLTNDSNFTNTITLEAEVNKWKNAYNDLRRRSVPAVFDNNELTILMDTPNSGANITLSQPYTNFDGLLIEGAYNSNGEFLNREYISSKELTRRKERCEERSKGLFALCSSHYYWWLTHIGFSSTLLPYKSGNFTIIRIYGVKVKEMT